MLLECPISPSGDQEGINLLLGDEVGTSLSFAECTEAVSNDGPPHLIWVHLQQRGCFLHCVVLHVLKVSIFESEQRQASPRVGKLLCRITRVVMFWP